MTAIDAWAKRASNVKVFAGVAFLVVTTVASWGAVAYSAIRDNTEDAMIAKEVPIRLDRLEQVQGEVVETLEIIEPGVAYLYCVERAKSEGREVGPYTCIPTGNER